MIYIIYAEGTTRFKIGFSKKPTRRLREGSTFNFGDQPFRLWAVMPTGTLEIEKFFHKILAPFKVQDAGNREWFDLPWLAHLLPYISLFQIVDRPIIEENVPLEQGDYGLVEIVNGPYKGLRARYIEEGDEEGTARLVLLEALVDQQMVDLPFQDCVLILKE